MSLDYLSCFAVLIYQTDYSILSNLRIFPYSEFMHGSTTFKESLKKISTIKFDVFIFSFIFFIRMSQTTSVTKHKWCVLFFTRIKLVARAGVCTYNRIHQMEKNERVSKNCLLSRLKLKSLDSVLRCNTLRWLGHVTQSQLYIGQILDMEMEVNRSCEHPKKCWLDAIKDDLRQWSLQAETCQNRS